MEMQALYLVGGLLALMMGYEIFSGDDNDDGDETEDREVTVDGQISADLDLGPGNDTLIGGRIGPSDDLIARVADDDRDPSVLPEIDGGAGDDRISIDHLAGISVFGGAGDDDIRLGHVTSHIAPDTAVQEVYVQGGSGDDRIIIGGASGNVSISGDDGDDVIVVDAMNGATVSVSGGAGDDIIQVQGVAMDPTGMLYLEAGGNDIEGNIEGADTFELSVRVTEDASNLSHLHARLEGDGIRPVAPAELLDASPDEIRDWLSSNGAYTPVAHIEHLDPAEDRLVVDPTSFANGATYEGYEIVNPGNGALGQLVVFHYSSPDHPEGLSLAIHVYAPGGITAEHISVVESLPDRAA
ncbi:MAG: calcium-binding protein [Paracoccus sp. (in: a-proteobacteria)]|nr:calcium-binding protein [Paracoccus sp. (in: a-proteobacteria)]